MADTSIIVLRLELFFYIYPVYLQSPTYLIYTLNHDRCDVGAKQGRRLGV